ncbi:hypothetical protein CP8484711_1080B, partial [Chlamydia psittaci 84-8471/1]
TIVMFAARACLTASKVCSLIPSSPATTSTTISQTSAPRALIAEKASWPGVSKIVIFPTGVEQQKAPICCVIAPASTAATLLFLSESIKVVFP